LVLSGFFEETVRISDDGAFSESPFAFKAKRFGFCGSMTFAPAIPSLQPYSAQAAFGLAVASR